jgi:hypothetical protein
MLSPTTELEAINTMLSTIGESPVNAVEDTGNVDVVIARQILQSVSREVQARGWHFNTEINYTITPDSEGYLVLPKTVLKVDTVYPDSSKDVVVRGSRLYDREKHTYVFTDAVKVDMTILLTFDELPEVARNCVTIRASRIFQERVVGSDTLHAFNSQDEARAMVSLMEYEADTADLNILSGNYSVYRILGDRPWV